MNEPGGSGTVAVHLSNSGSDVVTATVWLAPLGEEASWLAFAPEMRRVDVPPDGTLAVDFTAVTTPGTTTSLGEAELVVAWIEKGHRFTERNAVMIQAVRAGEEPPPPDAAVLLGALSVSLRTVAIAGAAGAAGGAVVGLAQLDWRRARAAVAAVLYSRINRFDAFDNENRRNVMAAIEESPGIHFSELLRRTGMPNGALYHHLRVLEQNGYVTSERRHGRRVYSPSGAKLDPPDVATPAERRILAALPPEGLTQGEIATRLGITRQGVGYHLQNLEARGLLRRRMVEGSWRYSRADASTS